MENLVKAINKAALELPLIGKNADVGFGRNTYKGTTWMDVAGAFNPILHKNGLAMIPIDYDVKTTMTDYVNQSGKPALRVFVEVKGKYKLMHSSGEFIEVVGLGHAVDNQDKGAGKACTYSLKNALLYAFTVAAGMEDTEATHIDDYDHAPQKVTQAQGQELLAICQTKPSQAVQACLNHFGAKSTAEVTAVNYQVVKDSLMGLQ